MTMNTQDPSRATRSRPRARSVVVPSLTPQPERTVTRGQPDAPVAFHRFTIDSTHKDLN